MRRALRSGWVALGGAVLSVACSYPARRFVPIDAAHGDGADRVDARPCVAGETACGDECVVLAASARHCGACEQACGAAQACVAGACRDEARPFAPTSLGVLTSRRPTFRWIPAPGVDGARVDICRDRACTRVVGSLVGATSVTPTADLPTGVLFWRIFARRGTVEASAPGVTWEFWIGPRDTLVDSATGMRLDVNGDGFTDVVVSAFGASPGGRGRAGEVRVYLGRPTSVSPDPQVVLEGREAFDWFGWSVANAGDVNGDGYSDVIVGAVQASPGGRSAAGRASVYLGGPQGLSATPYREFEGAVIDSVVGSSVVGAGDVNRDGFADIAIGASSVRPGGVVQVYMGGVDGISTTPALILEGGGVNDRFGWSVASAGDINGDGFADLIVGASLASPGGREQAGTASLYLGSPDGLSATPHRVLEGVASNDLLGTAVAGAGDVNGDGYADLVIGAPGFAPGGRLGTGLASVYLGSARGLSENPVSVLEGSAAADYFGVAVAGGDINGDGLADVLVGARNATYEGRSRAGTVGVYYGHATGVSPTSDVLVGGTGVGDWFGYSVANAGDLDGDEFADFVATSYSAVGGHDGRASVFLGRPTGVLTSRVLECGEGEAPGCSVARADDRGATPAQGRRSAGRRAVAFASHGDESLTTQRHFHGTGGP